LWGAICGYDKRPETEQKHIANAFLLACLLDYRRRDKIDDPWNAVYKFFENGPEFRDDLWRKIYETPEEEWRSDFAFRRHKLHRERPPHNRLWPIAEAITYWFDGDARLIWKDKDAFSTLARLHWIGAGEQISRMIVGALKDCGYVKGKGDPKADVRICRVIGRSILGEAIPISRPFSAIRISREIHPDDPWELDGPLWLLGEKTCTSIAPDCDRCYLRERCAYFQKNRTM
jgi:hypothetical protein